MSLRKTLVIGCAATVFFFTHVSAQPRPASADVSFTGPRDLVIDFPQPVQAWSNQVDGAQMRMQPDVPRICHWDSDTRLACRFERDVALATRYRIELAAGLKDFGGAGLPAQTLHAESERPRLDAQVREWHRGLPVIDLWSTTPLTPHALRAALRLRIDDAPTEMPLPTSLEPRWSGDRYFGFRLGLPPVTGANRTLRLDVVPGLRSTAGPLTGTQDGILLKALANEPFTLRGLSCSRREGDVRAVNDGGSVNARCLPGTPIRLELSRALSSTSRNWFAQHPPAGITVSPSDRWGSRFDATDHVQRAPGTWLVIEAGLPKHAYQLTLDNLQAEDGTRLPPVRIALATDQAIPQLLASHTGALLADPSRQPVLVQAINGGDATVEVEAVGARERRQTLQLHGANDDTPREVASSVARRALADGGWVRWTPVRGDASRQNLRGSREPAEFAAPAFDLYAVRGRREVLVWANEWERDAPVAGADVELMLRDKADADLRVVARGTTGDDGVAMLRLPDGLVLPDSDDDDAQAGAMWLVRARQARRGGRAVLPMNAQWANLGHARERITWGVSDRPMYRAGDTVRYRLWQRDRDGARLQQADVSKPVTLRLHDEGEGKMVSQWQATPSATGDISGELELPVHLTDGTYCIGVAARHGYQADGACFFVGSYRAQDLWAQLASPGGVLRDGQRLDATLKGGYYSGGNAAGVEVSELQLAIEPLPFEEAYPQYAQYAFIDVLDDAYGRVDLDIAVAGSGDDRLDRDGQARLQATLPLEGEPDRPPFGVLEISAEVAPQGREGTVANDTATHYARYPAFVGLRTIPAWPYGQSPVELEGVVVDAAGHALPDAAITVDVEFVPDQDDKAPAQQLAQCELQAGRVSRCDFARPGSGLYRFTAHSGDAAPVQVQHYLWSGDAGVRAHVQETELEVAAGSDATSLHTTLRQPFDRARALFVFASRDRIEGYRVESVTGNIAAFELTPPTSAGRSAKQLHVFVRAFASEKARIDDGFRTPAEVTFADARLPDAEPALAKPAPIAMSFEPARTQPGAKTRVVLRNDSDVPRDVVLSVMDDALRSLAQRWLDYADPHGASLLGRLGAGWNELEATGFGEMVDESRWRHLLPWPKESAENDADGSGDAAAPKSVGILAAQSLPAPSEEPPVVVDDPSPVDQPETYGETTLDRIQVTGSRISRSALESRESKAPDPGLQLRDPSEAAPGVPLALMRVRTRFVDTAAWYADLRLAPGETRSIDVALPDNLTRWRAVAWSSDDGDGFAMAEATLETGLPLEARLQAPVRLYPGDSSRLIAHVRQTGDAATRAQATLHFEGTDAPADRSATLQLTPKGQGSFGSVIAPQREGRLTAIAAAAATEGQDAVAQPIEIASPRIAARKVIAGWLGEASLALDIPPLPDGASDANVHVSLQHGVAGMVDDWTGYMRAYPHRCWEQILSRAVAAALALDRGDTGWTDAAAVVREAVDNAAVFQRQDGGFVYFAGGDGYLGGARANVVLTAYTVEAFALLRRLGHPVDAAIEKNAADFLARVKPADAPADRDAMAEFAYAAAARHDVAPAQLDALWRQWDRLPLPAQVATARALVANAYPAAAQATQQLLATTAKRGEARVFQLRQRHDGWMSSNLREQCSLIALLAQQPALDPDNARGALIAGLTDLYGGGTSSVDTQSGAICLQALHETARAGGGDVVARVGLGAAQGELQLTAQQQRAQWSTPLVAAAQLRIAMEPSSSRTTPTSFTARLDYLEDARVAQASAIGLAIGRRYAVFRDGDWQPLERSSLREGDWVRITLVIDNSATRRFVAVTDQAPGGLRPTDLSLSGVVVRDIERASSTGSVAFATRRLDARAPRFYAETLPAGHHEVHYFAVAGNGGDYLAAPAVAELMYGGASTARTAATRVRIGHRP